MFLHFSGNSSRLPISHTTWFFQQEQVVCLDDMRWCWWLREHYALLDFIRWWWRLNWYRNWILLLKCSLNNNYNNFKAILLYDYLWLRPLTEFIQVENLFIFSQTNRTCTNKWLGSFITQQQLQLFDSFFQIIIVFDSII